MSNNIVFGFLVDNTQVKITPKNWKFMEMGEGHVILENSNINDPLYSKVISICRHQIGSIPTPFQQLYYQTINFNQSLQKHLLKRDQILFSQSQIGNFKIMLSRILSVPVQHCKAFLAQNLSRSNNQWDYYLEFKPKSILPDVYSKQFLNQYCSKHKTNFQNIIQVLQTSPEIQKTRWFKKNARKQNKKNMDPFSIFSYKTITPPNYLRLIKQVQKDQQNTPKQPFNLNLQNKQISRVINQTFILSHILKIQMLFTQSHDLHESNLNQLWELQHNKQQLTKSIYSSIIQQLVSSQNIDNELQKLFKEASYPSSRKSIVNELERIVRFLISWSWKDISIILRFKVNEARDHITNFDLKIIDYQLKQASKLIETRKKDEQFLSEYLIFKQLL